jgi:hypothetical protein
MTPPSNNNNLFSLPEAVVFCFYDASPQWKVDAIKELQAPFWADPSVADSADRVTVYVENLGKRVSLRAVDCTVAVALVERLSDANGLNARYDDVMDAANAEASAEDDGKVYAPEDAI